MVCISEKTFFTNPSQQNSFESLLPNEITHFILTFFSLNDLSTFALTCKHEKEVTYNFCKKEIEKWGRTLHAENVSLIKIWKIILTSPHFAFLQSPFFTSLEKKAKESDKPISPDFPYDVFDNGKNATVVLEKGLALIDSKTKETLTSVSLRTLSDNIDFILNPTRDGILSAKIDKNGEAVVLIAAGISQFFYFFNALEVNHFHAYTRSSSLFDYFPSELSDHMKLIAVSDPCFFSFHKNSLIVEVEGDYCSIDKKSRSTATKILLYNLRTIPCRRTGFLPSPIVIEPGPFPNASLSDFYFSEDGKSIHCCYVAFPKIGDEFDFSKIDMQFSTINKKSIFISFHQTFTLDHKVQKEHSFRYLKGAKVIHEDGLILTYLPDGHLFVIKANSQPNNEMLDLGDTQLAKEMFLSDY